MVKIILNKDKFLEVVSETERIEDVKSFKEKVEQIKKSLTAKDDTFYLLNIVGNGDTIDYKKKYYYLIYNK